MDTTMKKQTMIAALALATLTSGAAMAQQVQAGDWLVRVRAVDLISANNDTTGQGLTVNNKWLPELDVSYFFSKSVAAELILTVPQSHSVYSNGTEIGTLKQLPPTLLVQYHFDAGGVKPYVGAGVNYTQFSSVDISSGAITTDNSSWGAALQLGVDIPIGPQTYLNVDVKKVYIKSNINTGGNSLGTLGVDPVLFGIGVGWRF